ncbi:hypothetical protein ACIA8C_37010 [Nocardia sp. NPDC051321]|uniref:hypothetical protein n=1 Tax=Nocardia sp. NPDC051321 TaxID=3364323 RepID=UPI0037B84D97
MRTTILATVTLVAALAGFTAAAVPASAVSDADTCASVSATANELTAGINASKASGAGSAAEVKAAFGTAAGKLDTAAANADEGAVKTAISGAVPYMNKAATASDNQLGAVLQDQELQNAMSALDQACRAS